MSKRRPSLLNPLPPGPWRCCICERFCAAVEENLDVEYGDYGSVLSECAICPRCRRGPEVGGK